MESIKIHPENITGIWYVVASDFPMWLKEDKYSPRFMYKMRDDGRLDDLVRYLKNNKWKSIRGTDKVSGTQFIWRGKGLLALARSIWEIIHYDYHEQVMVIRFRRTIFMPAGIDILTRNREIDRTKIEDIIDRLGHHGIDTGKVIRIEQSEN